ncbi:hypothetical protein [Streptomyces acidiscabies]
MISPVKAEGAGAEGAPAEKEAGAEAVVAAAAETKTHDSEDAR